MIRISRSFIQGVRAAQSAPDLHYYLQSAIKLEHSTIPPYLTALFSLKPGTNREIAALIRSIVIEEMLHMTIAANILIATGGRPQINTREFIPTYPGPLPMNIGSGLIVGIEAFSLELTKKVFMAIEEPEKPIPIAPPSLFAAAEPEYGTIGEFYDAVKQKIRDLGQSIFVQAAAPPQVIDNRWFPASDLFLITGPDTACQAIDIIKIEGEGTSTDPFQSGRDPAHYYKFGEIVNGRGIVQTPTGYAYDGPPIPFDAAGVWPLRPNCRITDFPEGSQARNRIERFANAYATLLNSLHLTCNGHPEQLQTAIGIMYDLRVFAVALMQTDIGNGQTAGPSFEYVQTQTGA
ncbi:MAG TPA: ferritin-like protein [Bryobacteraceae bacterium]|nr:ferritin-like protein [Bryobacteraceae bacterium]